MLIFNKKNENPNIEATLKKFIYGKKKFWIEIIVEKSCRNKNCINFNQVFIQTK